MSNTMLPTRYEVKFEVEASNLGKLTGKRHQYWSSVLGQYVFDRAYGTDPTLGKCSSGDEGFSNYQADSGLPFMVLCDKSFQSNGRLPLSVAPVPIWSNQFTDNTPDTAAQEIYEILPECITFAHELFHLVLGNDLSVPSMGEEYSFPQIMGIQPRADGQAPMTTEGNLANPETYALVAYVHIASSRWREITDHFIQCCFPIHYDG